MRNSQDVLAPIFSILIVAIGLFLLGRIWVDFSSNLDPIEAEHYHLIQKREQRRPLQ